MQLPGAEQLQEISRGDEQQTSNQAWCGTEGLWQRDYLVGPVLLPHGNTAFSSATGLRYHSYIFL